MDLGEQVLERHRSEGWNRFDGYDDVELLIERLPEKVSAPCGDPGVLPPVEQAERVLRDVDDGDVVPTLGQGHRESSAASTGVHNTLPCFTHVSEQKGQFSPGFVPAHGVCIAFGVFNIPEVCGRQVHWFWWSLWRDWRTWLSDVPIERLRSEEHTSELQSRFDLVCRLLLEKKKKKNSDINYI